MLLFAPIRWIYKLVSLVITAAVIYVVVSGVQVVLASNIPTSPRAAPVAPSAIVVMIPTSASPTLNGDTTNRLEEAIMLFDNHEAERIILTETGVYLNQPSTSSTNTNPNPTIKNSFSYLTSRGIPGGQISRVTGKTTYAGLSSVSHLLGPRYHVIIVTDGINTLWTAHAAGAAGLRANIVRPINSPNKLFIFEFGSLWRQATGIASGRIIGFNHTPWVNS